METGPSKAQHDHDAWDPDWIENRFVGMLECSAPACKELAAVSGSSGIDYVQVDWDSYESSNVFRVSSITPAPIPIRYPESTPDTIVAAIERAAELIWLSPQSAANQIRQAVEGLMDDAGVSATTATGQRIHLHARIEQFAVTDAENGKVLLATKWLGNSGSHPGGMERDDVLDAFEMIEFVLEDRYGTSKAKLMAKVDAVNAAKGPAAKSKP